MRSIMMLAVALATALLPVPARAQFRPGPGGFGAGGPAWSPIGAARGGWSLRDASPSLGLELRLPLPVPVLRPSVAASGDFIFQSGLVEAQGMLEATLGIFSPLYFGGGPAVLSSVFDDATGRRETKQGFSLVAGVRAGRTGPLSTEISFRTVRVAQLHPRYLMITFGYPLFRLLGS